MTAAKGISVSVILSCQALLAYTPGWAQHVPAGSPKVQLAAGKQVYERYCAGCHGVKGDGKGPAAIFLDPKPRDFTSGKFKFASVPSGKLPRDEDLHRTIVNGLAGTSMPAWPLIPEYQRQALVAYLKTFSDRWRDEQGTTPILVPKDPFRGSTEKIRAGIKQGEKVYHTLTQCWQCHPGYVTPQQMEDYMKEAGRAFAGVRNDWNKPVLKDDGWGEPLMPTDFLKDRIKTGLDMNNLFLVIAAGIGGTAMPTWKDSIPDEDIWALAYYVRSLADKRNEPLRNLPLAPPPQFAEAPPPSPAESTARKETTSAATEKSDESGTSEYE